MVEAVHDMRFRSVYELHHADVLAYFMRRLSSGDAVEAAADVFLVVWRKIDELPAGDEIRPWLFGIAHNVLRNRQRTLRRVGRLVGRMASEPRQPPPEPDALVVMQSENEAVVKALRSLPPATQEVLRLRLWEEVSYDEMASILGCSRHAAEQRYAKALGKLRSACRRTGHVGVTEKARTQQEQEQTGEA